MLDEETNGVIEPGSYLACEPPVCVCVYVCVCTTDRETVIADALSGLVDMLQCCCHLVG